MNPQNFLLNDSKGSVVETETVFRDWTKVATDRIEKRLAVTLPEGATWNGDIWWTARPGKYPFSLEITGERFWKRI